MHPTPHFDQIQAVPQRACPVSEIVRCRLCARILADYWSSWKRSECTMPLAWSHFIYLFINALQHKC